MAFKMRGITPLKQKTSKEELDPIPPESQKTDEERETYLVEQGVTSAELSEELSRLAELHGDDDIDYEQWKSVVDSLSAVKQPEQYAI